MKNLIDENLIFSTFADRMCFNTEMLNYRVERLLAIDTTDKINKQEYQMVFDATFVLFRSMFLEKREVNYTFQNYFRGTKRQEIADKIDNVLDAKFNYSSASIRDVLKFISDKFICHQDKVTNLDIGMMQAYTANLCNPYFSNNFGNIMQRLCSIINEAYR